MSGVRGMRGKGRTAAGIAAKLAATGWAAEPAYDELAVTIADPEGNRICLLWMPTSDEDGGSAMPLDHLYLWGRTGEEHRAPDSTGVDELVALIVATLPNVVEA